MATSIDQARHGLEDGFDRLFDLHMGRLVERLLSESFVVIAAPPPPSTEDRPDPAAHLKAELRNGGFGFIQMGWERIAAAPIEGCRALLLVPMMTSVQAAEVMAAVSDPSERSSGTLSLIGVKDYGPDTCAGVTVLAEEAASRDGSDFLAETRSNGRCFRVEDIDLQPSTVRDYRECFGSVTTGEVVVARCRQLYQLHAYAGNPPPMLPRNGITRFIGDLPGVNSLIAYIPFVPQGDPKASGGA